MIRHKVQSMTYGGITLEFGKKTLIMGILNATPDSFSDGGRFNTVDSALVQAEYMIIEGADVLDIGGESTRPGFKPVELEEELERIIPIIKAISKRWPHIPISVDTYKAEVARQALEAGAHIINDVWGFKADPAMAGVAAQYGCPVILMHNRDNLNYNNLVEDVQSDLQESIAIAMQAGVLAEHIMLDPGIGFAKTKENNLELMRSLEQINALGYPVLLGTSRKTFIRTILNLPADDVVEGTAVTVALGIAQGCDMVRVHDIKPIKRTVMMTDAIMRT